MKSIVLWLAAVLCCGVVQAQVPRQINYQGYLTDPGGTPVSATLAMEFRLYNVATSGAALFTEAQSVTVNNGVFNVLIGAQPGQPLGLPFDVPYWLGVKVDTDTEMAPRQPLAAAPYAIRAASSEALATSATVVGSQIAGSISSATLPAGSLIGSIPVASGGTGQTSLTSNGILYGQGAAGVGVTAPGVAGQVLAGSAGAPVWTGSPALSGNLTLVNSTATSGNIMKGANHFIHNFGADNTFIGESAGNFTMSGGGNTASGFNALVTNTTGNQNTASGNAALWRNTTGSGNIALGAAAGQNLTTGDNNIAIGNSGVAGESGAIRLGDPAVHTKTALAGNVGIGTASPLVKLHVTPGTAKTDPANTRAFAVLTNEPLGANGDPNNPFGLDVRLSGGAAVADRSVYLQSTNFNTADGGNILLQPFGGNVGIGATSTGSTLTVAGRIETTSGGVKFPDGNTQTKALANCSAEGDVAVVQGGAWVCKSSLPRYVDNGNGTVTDNKTGLMWEKKLASTDAACLDPTQANRNVRCVQNTYTWSAASPYTEPTGTLYSDFLEKLNDMKTPNDGTATPCFAGYCDWRLPILGELRSILLAPYTGCPSSPCIDAIFGPTQASYYWSSSSLVSNPLGAWSVYFDAGFVFNGSKDGGNYTRAVRSGR